MYIRNKSRPNRELWETPAFILNQNELWPLRITLFFKKSVKRLNKPREVPLCLSLSLIPSCHTLLKAFEISKNTL